VSKWPGDGGKEPGLAGGLGLVLMMMICCAGVPFLAGGAGFLAGILTDTRIAMLGGLALMVLGAVLLWRRRQR
jgi:LPXTG-motif cell wall-anchored protein